MLGKHSTTGPVETLLEPSHHAVRKPKEAPRKRKHKKPCGTVRPNSPAEAPTAVASRHVSEDTQMTPAAESPPVIEYAQVRPQT
jgi:hypothetical protein